MSKLYLFLVVCVSGLAIGSLQAKTDEYYVGLDRNPASGLNYSFSMYRNTPHGSEHGSHKLLNGYSGRDEYPPGNDKGGVAGGQSGLITFSWRLIFYTTVGAGFFLSIYSDGERSEVSRWPILAKVAVYFLDSWRTDSNLPLFNQIAQQEQSIEHQIVFVPVLGTNDWLYRLINGPSGVLNANHHANKFKIETKALSVLEGDDGKRHDQVNHIHRKEGSCCPACYNGPCVCIECSQRLVDDFLSEFTALVDSHSLENVLDETLVSRTSCRIEGEGIYCTQRSTGESEQRGFEISTVSSNEIEYSILDSGLADSNEQQFEDDVFVADSRQQSDITDLTEDEQAELAHQLSTLWDDLYYDVRMQGHASSDNIHLPVTAFLQGAGSRIGQLLTVDRELHEAWEAFAESVVHCLEWSVDSGCMSPTVRRGSVRRYRRSIRLSDVELDRQTAFNNAREEVRSARRRLHHFSFSERAQMIVRRMVAPAKLMWVRAKAKHANRRNVKYQQKKIAPMEHLLEEQIHEYLNSSPVWGEVQSNYQYFIRLLGNKLPDYTWPGLEGSNMLKMLSGWVVSAMKGRAWRDSDYVLHVALFGVRELVRKED